MAPFNTHFLVAEQIWPYLPPACQPHCGQFFFGCVAPDVDKVSAALTQKDTHFFDRTTAYELMASHRSAAFIQHQAGFFCRPFKQLSAGEQAFALGYLCHLCVDEVSKFMWQRPIWRPFVEIGSGLAFAALDEYARTQLRDYPAVAEAVQNVTIPPIIPIVSQADWQIFQRGVADFVRTGSAEHEFLALVDMFDRLSSLDRQQRLLAFRANINAARERIGVFELQKMVAASITRTMQRMAELLTQRRALPGLPKIT